MKSEKDNTIKLHQNWYILSQMSIPLWATHKSKTQQLATRSQSINCSRFSQHNTTCAGSLVVDLKSENTVNAINIVDNHTTHLENNKALQQTQINNQLFIQDTIKQLPQKHLQKNLEKTLKTDDESDKTDFLNIRYQIQAICYHDWVLMIDEAFLDESQKNLWQSLSDALKNQAKTTKINYLALNFSYPISQDIDDANQEAKNPLLAQSAFMGFLFGLTAADDSRLIFLSQTHPVLQLPKSAHFQLKLDQLFDNEQKRKFWRWLHADS